MQFHSRGVLGALLAVTGSGACARHAPAPDTSRADSHSAAAHSAHHPSRPDSSRVDSSFAALQARGRVAMGVDQYTSTHVFEPLADGGRIVLLRDVDDTAGVSQIRAHLRSIAVAFANGDFDIPGVVHAREVPGTVVMAAKRRAISYSFSERPRGGELRISTTDPAALAAVHEFLAFQRRDHRVGPKR